MSTLRFYKVDFKKENNFIIDDLTDYLNGKQITLLTNFQYIKNDLSLSIKISMNQSQLNIESDTFNYLAVNNGDGATYYYFIDSKKWVAQLTLQLNLSLDVLNTLRIGQDYDFSNKTRIIREHKNRFNNLDVTTQSAQIVRAFPLIDFNAEDVNASLISNDLPKTIDVTKDDIKQNRRKWYLIYKSNAEGDNVPINCYLCSDSLLHTGLTSSGGVKTIYPSDLELNKYYYFVFDDNGVGANFDLFNNVAYNHTLDNTTKRVYIFYREVIDRVSYIRINNYEYNANGSHTATSQPSVYRGNYIRANKMAIARILPYATNNLGDILASTSIFSVNAGNVSGFDVLPINSVDKTDSKLIKIIELPYAPAEVYENFNNDNIIFNSNIWEYAYNVSMLKLKDLNADLSNTFKTYSDYFLSDVFFNNIKVPITRTDQAMRYIKDTKLKHSQFYQPKFLYDSFAYVVKMETFNLSTFSSLWANKYLNITFTPSNSFNSRFLFTFEDFASNSNVGEDYHNILIVNRNNEVPIYTSAYIDYIRNGYNYDVKAKERNDASRAVAIALNAVGSIASFLSTPVTGGVGIAGGIGLATSTASQIASAVASSSANAQNIEKTLNNLSQQSASVSNSDTLDLLNKYNGNKLQFKLYKIDDRMYKLLDDLFYYTGYKCDELGIPSYDTRIYFNFVQCEAVFINVNTEIYSDYIESLRMKYSEGVTFIHHYNNTWDTAQELENLETFLIQYL